MVGEAMNLRREQSKALAAANDAELARAAQRGDKRAFVEIVARYQGLVCGIALSILGDFAASEDAGQEAFLTAWRKIHDLREPERLRGWLSQIARNAALGQLRGEKRLEALEEEAGLADEAPSPDEAAATEEEAALVRASLAKLPETYRLPLILYYREGQSVRAVAEALGISEDAAKQRLARGRELCREKLATTIEGVLGKTKPSTIFTMAIAVAIGALAAPSAMAAASFAAGATAGTATSTTGISLKTAFSTIMTTSKAFLLAAATVALVCVPIGYQLRSTEPAKLKTAPAPTAAKALSEPAVVAPKLGDSALVAQWRELHQTYGTNAEAMPKLYEAIKGLKDAFQRQALGAALISEWAQVDPAGGLAFLLGNGHSSDERQDFFREWLGRDPKAAVAALMASSGDWKGLAHDCLRDIAQAAPNHVAEIVAQLPKSDDYWDHTVREAFTTVAEWNLTEAQKEAEALTGPNREEALGGVASAWAQTDLNAAITWAKGLPDDVDKAELIRCALVGTAGVNPALALDNVGAAPSGGSQLYFASTTGARVLSAAASADFDATLSWLANNPSRINYDDAVGLAGEVTERLNADPAGFLSAREADGTLGALMPAIGSALLNGSAGERTAIWSWIQDQPASDALSSLEKDVLSSTGYQDPVTAIQMATNLPSTAADAASLQQLVTQCVFNGGQALDRFNDIYAAAPDSLKGPLAQEAFSLLGNQQGFPDPQAWIAALQDLPASGLNQGAQSLGKAWGTQSPSDAVAWAQSLPAGPEQDAVLAGITSGWAGRDATGAANWILTLPEGAERDQSAAALATTIAQQQPSDAWSWAISIGDSTVRDSAAASVIPWVAQQNPSTARQLIDSGPFDSAEKATLTGLLAKSSH